MPRSVIATPLRRDGPFLLKDADNKGIREEMFVALEQLKDNQQVSFLTGYVLISDYHTTAENKSALQGERM